MVTVGSRQVKILRLCQRFFINSYSVAIYIIALYFQHRCSGSRSERDIVDKKHEPEITNRTYGKTLGACRQIDHIFLPGGRHGINFAKRTIAQSHRIGTAFGRNQNFHGIRSHYRITACKKRHFS